jgi:hypothetical protein
VLAEADRLDQIGKLRDEPDQIVYDWSRPIVESRQRNCGKIVPAVLYL